MKTFLIFLIISIASVNGITIECEFVDGSLLEGNVTLWTDYSCWVIGVNYTGSATHVTGYSGTHRSGYSDALVKGVFFDDELCPWFNLTFVPKGFSSIFPNILGVFFENCEIDIINGDELDEFPNLRWWVIQFSPLERVPAEFFAQTPLIKYVGFDDNLIERVGQGLLDGFADLEKVHFLRNICINKWAFNASMIPAVIRNLEDYCEDFYRTPVPTTSTTTTTTTTTPRPNPPTCEINNVEDFACELDEGLTAVITRGENMQGQINELEEGGQDLRSEIEDLKAKNEVVKEAIRIIEQEILDLKSRPCACK